MRVIIHKAVGIDFDSIALFVFAQEVVIELFGPVLPEQPVFIVALPGDVEEGVVAYDCGSWSGNHGNLWSKGGAKLHMNEFKGLVTSS